MNSSHPATKIIAGGMFFLASAWALPQAADAPNGEALFDAKCKSCHEPPVERAPNRAALRVRSQADIVQSLRSGVMAPMANGMSPAEMQAVAAFLSPSQSAENATALFAPTAPSRGVDVPCASHPPIAAREGDWSTLGVSNDSSRFQRRPELSTADLSKLKLKWAYTMPGGGQPTVVGDWLFITNRGDKMYALDAKTGCVHWTLTDVNSRTTPMVVRAAISPSGWATFVGVQGRIVRAIDAQTGKDIWKSEPLEAHVAGNITGTPIVYGDKVFVPMSSLEEVAGAQENYPCCSFRGSLSALDANTGKVLWKTYTISEPLKPTRKNAKGTQLQGPAGAAIWASPTVDEKRKLVYVVTGDSYTEADTKGADAVMAIEMESGKIRWSHQATEADNFTLACTGAQRNSSCPTPEGPDVDFGASPVLFSLRNGRGIVVAGQKSGVVYGFDADSGKRIWKTQVGSGSALGGIEWGIGADDRYVFVPNADTVLLIDEVLRRRGEPQVMAIDLPAKPGLSALDPATGKVVWNVPAPNAPCKYAGDVSRQRTKGECVRAQSAAPAVIPGAVFSGTLDGWMRAYDSSTGKILWAYSTTAQTYDTVNGIKGQPGGGIDGMGPTIAHGMVYFMSGFNGASSTGSNGNNVLLAFSVDGK